MTYMHKMHDTCMLSASDQKIGFRKVVCKCHSYLVIDLEKF